MSQKAQARTGAAQGLIELFENVRKQAGEDMSAATLGYVKEVTRAFEGGYGIADVLPVPQWDSDGTNLISAYFFSEPAPVEGQLVLIVFTDRDFRSVIAAQTGQTGVTANLNTHSKNFGVMIKL